jgi:hypothetical protein
MNCAENTGQTQKGMVTEMQIINLLDQDLVKHSLCPKNKESSVWAGSEECQKCDHFWGKKLNHNGNRCIACSFIADMMDREVERSEDAACSAQGCDT